MNRLGIQTDVENDCINHFKIKLYSYKLYKIDLNLESQVSQVSSPLCGVL